MYGQQSWPVGPAKPQKPGPTGVGVAIASGFVPVMCYVVSLLTRQYTFIGYSGYPVALVANLSPYLIVACYLAIAGRGALGKGLGATCWLVAGCVISVSLFYPRSFIRSDAGSAAILIAGLVAVTLTILGWGFARRTGWSWLVGVPVAIVMSLVMSYVVGPQVRPLIGRSAYLYVGPALSILLVRVVPVLIGWGAEALGPESSNAGRTGSSPARVCSTRAASTGSASPARRSSTTRARSSSTGSAHPRPRINLRPETGSNSEIAQFRGYFRSAGRPVQGYRHPMSLGAEKTISVTTVRKSGEKVSTPVWVVPVDGGRIGFWTSSGSGKAKRLRNNPEVEVTACNQRGALTPGAPTIAGVAELVTSGPEFDAVQAAVKAKYGFQVPMSKLFNTIGAKLKGRTQPYGDTVVVITPAASA